MCETQLMIRTMLPEDIKAVSLLEEQLFTLPWTEKGFLDSLQSEYTEYLTAWIGKELAGYCGYLQSFEEADITNVAVSPRFQHQGIGFRMLSELMETGKNRGIERFTLEVRAGNTAALGLYKKLGFESVGIRKRFYEKPTEDAVIMWTK